MAARMLEAIAVTEGENISFMSLLQTGSSQALVRACEAVTSSRPTLTVLHGHPPHRGLDNHRAYPTYPIGRIVLRCRLCTDVSGMKHIVNIART